MSMDKSKKKKYVKPQVTKITLDAKCAVLGFCKGPGDEGPGGTGCGGLGCFSQGS
jgi:hypothetical protein